MVSCLSGCWGALTFELRRLGRPALPRARKYRRAKYSEKEVSIEFENLIDDEDFEPRPRRILTDVETELITQKRYDELLEQQKKQDADIDAQLWKQEEDLKLEEEAYYEAKKEAARVAKQTKQAQEPKPPKGKSSRGFLDDSSLSSWNTSDDGLSLDSVDMDVEDFDAFLEKVKARSLSAHKPSGPISPLSNGHALDESWEDALVQGMEATRIAGKSLEALEAFSSAPNQNTVDR